MSEGQRIVAIGADHAGSALKERVAAHLRNKGYVVVDHGTQGGESVDYPDHAHKVAEDVAKGRAWLGVVLCGSGNGVNITANKHAGVRSALAWTAEVAALARQHNDANVLAVPARFVSEDEAFGMVDAFMEAVFEGGRHQRRVDKIEVKSGC